MSGGHFDFDQYRIGRIAAKIEILIDNNDSTEKTDIGYRVGRGFRPGTIEKFKEAVRALHKAEILTQRIDWLVSGDDTEISFHDRLEEDMLKFET